jgi:hypothetical protein
MTTAIILRKYQNIIEGNSEEKIEEVTESVHLTPYLNNTQIIRRYQDILMEAEDDQPELTWPKGRDRVNRFFDKDTQTWWLRSRAGAKIYSVKVSDLTKIGLPIQHLERKMAADIASNTHDTVTRYSPETLVEPAASKEETLVEPAAPEEETPPAVQGDKFGPTYPHSAAAELKAAAVHRAAKDHNFDLNTNSQEKPPLKINPIVNHELPVLPASEKPRLHVKAQEPKSGAKKLSPFAHIGKFTGGKTLAGKKIDPNEIWWQTKQAEKESLTTR